MKKKTNYLIPVTLHNVRVGLATNSSSTHSVIYKNKDDMFEDLNIFKLDYYDRFDTTIAATREAKIKYILANIKHNLRLVQAMSELYPEMKQYFSLIKEDIENSKGDEYIGPKFGMYCRGNLYFEDDEHVSVEYLKRIIEDENFIIVGGSDEEDFVSDIVEGHKRLPSAYECVNDFHWRHRGLYSNGNYFVAFIRDDDDGQKKIRFAFAGTEPVPEYPELIDLRITNRCDNGCPFCFMDSKMSEKDADLYFIMHRVIRSVPKGTEFSLGGGNVLLHPNFKEIVNAMKENELICNITIHARDVEKLKADKELTKFIYTNVDGIGISVTSLDDVEKYLEIENLFEDIRKEIFDQNEHFCENESPWICVHMIPEMLGADKTIEIIKPLKESGYRNFLFLGYKNVGRGKNVTAKKLSDGDLKNIFSLFEDSHCISVDTAFANTYKDYIDLEFYTEKCVELNEGQWSMYIDGVNEVACKSSYETETPISLETYYESVRSAFGDIREQCGFKRYDGTEFLE